MGTTWSEKDSWSSNVTPRFSLIGVRDEAVILMLTCDGEIETRPRGHLGGRTRIVECRLCSGEFRKPCEWLTEPKVVVYIA